MALDGCHVHDICDSHWAVVKDSNSGIHSPEQVSVQIIFAFPLWYEVGEVASASLGDGSAIFLIDLSVG
jgi:hypothetical protein